MADTWKATKAGKQALIWHPALPWCLLVPCPVWLPGIIALVCHGNLMVLYGPPQAGIQCPPIMELPELGPVLVVPVMEPLPGLAGPCPTVLVWKLLPQDVHLVANGLPLLVLPHG